MSHENAIIPSPAVHPFIDITDSGLAGDAQPLSQNPAAVYIAALSEGSRRTMIHALNTIAEMLGQPPVLAERQDQRSGDPAKTLSENLTYLSVRWSELRYQHVAAVRAQLAERFNPGGANKTLAALRGVLKQAWKLGQMSAEDYYRARDVEPVRGATARPATGRSLTAGEIDALIRACEIDPTPAGVRDAAIISLMYVTGCRRSSVPKLDLADYRRSTGMIIFRGAKGKKDYTGSIENGARHALEDWLALRGQEPGPLFCPVSQTGVVERLHADGTPRRLTGQAIYSLLAKRGKQAGISDFSPHDLRRTVAGDLLDLGVDIVTVKEMLGHASIETTAGYDRRPEQRKRAAAQKLHVPYHGNVQKRLPDL